LSKFGFLSKGIFMDKDCEAPKYDHRDWGRMGHFDSPMKPKCVCGGQVSAVGKDGDWTWDCLQCRRSRWHPDGSVFVPYDADCFDILKTQT
jgi:hypothetical protein